jgi:hypothetical protein
VFGGGECGHRVGLGDVGPRSGQSARRAQPSCTAVGVGLDQPIAFGGITVGAQLELTGVDRAAVLAVYAAGDDQQRPMVEGVSQLAAARQAQRVLERQVLTSVGADEITHRQPSFRAARYTPRDQARFAGDQHPFRWTAPA